MQEATMPDQGYLSWRAVCGVTVLVLTLTVMALAQSSQHEDDPTANQVLSGSAFGYADGPGRHVLVPVETALARGMQGFHKAVAAPGRVIELTYAGAQRGGMGLAGELAPERFDETAGAVFSAQEPIGAGNDVLVATDRFLADRQVLKITPQAATDCDAALHRTLAGRSDKPLSWCRTVATVEDGGTISLARFSDPDGAKSMTLAYSGKSAPVFLDYPSRTETAGPWNLDATGDVSPESYRPLFAFRTDKGLELAVRWSGPEGNAMDLYRQQGDVFVPFVAAAWPRLD